MRVTCLLERGPFDLEENTSYIIEAMKVLGPELNVIALCQAGVPALVATAYHSDNDQGCAPCSLVLIAAPIDPAANPTRVSRLIRSRTLSWYEHNVITEVTSPDAGKGRLVYPGSVQLFGLWAYLARHLREGGELLGKLLADDGADPARFPFLDLYSAVMDLPAEVFLDIMRHVYQERTLVRGKYHVAQPDCGLAKHSRNGAHDSGRRVRRHRCTRADATSPRLVSIRSRRRPPAAGRTCLRTFLSLPWRAFGAPAFCQRCGLSSTDLAVQEVARRADRLSVTPMPRKLVTSVE